MRDRGATALIVAIVVPVLLLGLGALIVDVGSWYSGRAMDQNAADAGVMAVAETCYPGPCQPSLASGYADGSSNGELAGQVYKSVCGTVSGTPASVMPTCSTAGIVEDGKACPLPPQAGTDYVDVMVAPKNRDSSPTLTSFLGLGKQQVGACAQAQLGAVGGGTGLALTMSICDWLADTNAKYSGDPNAVYARPTPPYPTNAWPVPYPGTVTDKNPAVPNVGGENVVQITGPGKCGAGQSGLNVPGGFGWLSDQPNHQPPAGCQVTTSAGGFVYTSSGGIKGQNGICGTALQNTYNAGTPIPNRLNPIFLPIFDAACGSDGKLQPDDSTPCASAYPGMPPSSYHIAGYAQFVLTGFDYNPFSNGSMINGADPCKGGNVSCLYGLFTQGLVSTPVTTCTSNCPPFGALAARLTG